MRAQMSALTLAHRQGKPVVVSSLTTATSQVVAQPDGMYELQSSASAVRVRRDGAWVPVSVKLVAVPGGWAPAAASMPVVFSGGGTGPVVTVTDPASGGTVSVWWPTALPKPVVSGSAALYRGVLPGVDLCMEATNAGYGDVLVVRDAAAAADPGLRSLTERVQASSGLLAAEGARRGARGQRPGEPQAGADVRGADDVGLQRHPRGDRHPAVGRLRGAGRVTAVPAAYRLLGDGTAMVTMRPPGAALAGPAVRYPLFIDPTTGDETTAYYAEVLEDSDSNTQAWTTGSGTTSVGSNDLEARLLRLLELRPVRRGSHLYRP